MLFGIPQYHQNPATLHIGTLPPRAYFIPYESAHAAERDIRSESENFKTLCGTWDFHWFASPDDVLDFLHETLSYDKLDVPMNWQNATGRGYDTPNYTNIEYPYPLDPPHVPQQNPCGLYTRTFTLPVGILEKKDIILNFEGVDSCFYLFVNNLFVAYSQVSHMTSEVDITPFVQEGINRIHVLVLKWCDGSYLEDQDMFRASGIFREVYLLYRERVRMEDIFLRWDLPDDFSVASIRAEIKMRGEATLHYRLSDPGAKTVCEGDAVVSGDTVVRLPQIRRPVLWNPEAPALYRLALSVGKEFFSFDIGLRKVQVRGKVIYVNGVKCKCRGVNRHDSHPLLGHATPPQHMLRDILLMKANNVNMVRTSHYPNDPRWLTLCDRYGLFVCDEADLEAHGFGIEDTDTHPLTTDPLWEEAYVDRARRMLERDKNHPCIIFWSVGNESAAGRNHKAEIAYFKSRDDSRLVHAEDESRRIAELRLLQDQGKPLPVPEETYGSYLDFDSRMYPSPEQIRQYYVEDKRQTRPLWLCEYSHAMGVGPGDLGTYWDLIYENDCLFGGCVWEWTDHSVATGDNVHAHPHYTYGGDFGDTPHAANFCVDGLLYPDRRAHTGLRELKQVYKPFSATYEAGKLTVRNRRDFTDLSDLELVYSVQTDGSTITVGTLGALNIPPHAEKTYSVPLPADLGAGVSTLLCRVRQRTATEWGDVGYEVGFAQFILSDTPARICPAAGETPLLRETPDAFLITDGDTVTRISRRTGLIDSLISDGRQMLCAPITPAVWRAPIDNDRVVRREWEKYGFDRLQVQAYEVTAKEESDAVTVRAVLSLAAAALPPVMRLTITYLLRGGQATQIHTAATVAKEVCALPRFGFDVRMPEHSESVRYFGYGPGESYEDMHRSAYLSLFSTTATENYEPYIRPQSNSAHCHTRLCEVSSVAGHGLFFGARDFSFSVSHFSEKTLSETAHHWQLKADADTFLRIDYRNSGVGSHSCGPVLAAPYRIDEKEFEFTFFVRPVFAGNCDLFREYAKLPL